MHKRWARRRLLALFAAGGLLLNFPLLALWDRDATVARPAAVARWRCSSSGRR